LPGLNYDPVRGKAEQTGSGNQILRIHCQTAARPLHHRVEQQDAFSDDLDPWEMGDRPPPLPFATLRSG
jgi:hypothetical protein